MVVIPSLLNAAGTGNAQYIRDHAKQSGELARQQALAVGAVVGRAGAVRALLDAGADPRALLPKGFHPHATALHLALLHGHWPAATELLHYGARLDVPLDALEGASAAEWAAHSPDASIAENCATALAFYRAVDAVVVGDTVRLAELLEQHAGLASTRVVGQPRYLLHYATDWPGHRPNIAATVALLVEHGANPDAVMEPGWSLREGEVGPATEGALHWSASNDDVAAIEALVMAGADQTLTGGSFGNGTALWSPPGALRARVTRAGAAAQQRRIWRH
jgi:ankyrin repeat protein